MLGGKPLLLHTVRAALAASRIGRVIVSTDDAAIARVALEAGAEVPSLRPADLARDESPMLGAIHHALAVAEAGGRWVEVVVLLQPTSPFRTNRHIDEAIGVYEASRADTVTAVRAAAEHPYYAWKRDGDHLVPFFAMQHEQTVRQELPEALVETGAIFVLRRGVIDAGAFYGDRIVPYEMDDLSSIDIDTPQDLAFAEFLLARNPGTGNS